MNSGTDFDTTLARFPSGESPSLRSCCHSLFSAAGFFLLQGKVSAVIAFVPLLPGENKRGEQWRLMSCSSSVQEIDT